jgi:sphingomyelin phosphodiesterase acid-like 3
MISNSFSRGALLLVGALLCLSPSVLAKQSKSQTTTNVLSISDIHFTPFSDTSLVSILVQTPYLKWDDVFAKSKHHELPAYKQETNDVLYNNVLSAIKATKPKLSGIVFTGDLLAHDFNELTDHYTGATTQYARNHFILQTISYLTLKMKRTFPNVPIYFVLGNNDSYGGDYVLEDDGEFLHTTADMFFKHLIQRPQDSVDFYQTYPVHGYYSLPFSAIQNGRIIGLNSIYFSTNYYSATGDPGQQELDWLEKQLAKSQQANEHVWILQHIPPGINVYSTQHNSSPEKISVSLLWKKSYNDRYLDILQRYSQIISASFAGHTHMDDFRMVYSSDSTHRALGSIHITPAISPVFGNNPAFQLLQVNPQTGSFVESTTYFADLSNKENFKKEYQYSAAYHVKPDLPGLRATDSLMGQDSSLRESYVHYYYTSSFASSIASTWKWYWCGIGHLTADDYVRSCSAILKAKD